MNKLLDYKNEYNSLNYKCNLEGAEALKEVRQCGYALQFVKEQTEEICLAAVRHYGHALQFVKEQTKEICLTAVREDGYALKYVHNQTEEICLAAVKQNGDALKYVNSKFFEEEITVENIINKLSPEEKKYLTNLLK